MKEDHFANCLEKGIRFAQEGNLTQAQIYLSQAVQANPDSARAWFLLNLVIKDPEKKKYCLSKAVELDPNIATTDPGINKKADPFPFTSDRISFENKTSQVSPPSVGPKDSPFIQRTPVQSTFNSADSFESKPSPHAKTTESPPEMSKDGQGKPEHKHGRFSPLYILLGLLISLMACGIPITYLTLSGSMDSLLPYFDQGKSTSQNVPIFANTSTLKSFPPTLTITVPPTSTTTLVLNTETPIQSIAVEMYSAANRMAAKDYTNAIVILDRVISIDPENVEAYYQRGLAYLNMIKSLRSQAEYLNYLEKSLNDFDHAIAIGPPKGDYFVHRAIILWDIAYELDYRVDRDPLFAAALENMHLGMAFGTTIESVPFDAARLHNLNGHCEIGLSELQELERAQNSKTSQYYDIEKVMAETYACLGQYEKALEKINEALKCNCDFWQYNIFKAEILYFLGEKDQALEILNKDIELAPGGAGSRYYHRALIYYDQGKYDLARDDLEMGAGNTWWHAGIFPYLSAKFAVMNGDMESAKSFLQYAEASLLRNENPSLVKWIKNDMAALGIAPLSPTPQFFLDITPIPSSLFESVPPTATSTLHITPQAGIPTPGVSALPVGYLDAIPIDFTYGIGQRTIDPGSHVLFYFVLQEPITVIRATKIIFHLLPEGGPKPPLQIYMWTRSGGWRMIDPVFGENVIDYPSFYIGEKGDFYISIRNYSSSEPVTFDNAGFTVTVERADGSTFTYGLNP